MTTTIEREIVQFMFDTKNFQNGIKDSLRGIADLKKSLDFNRAQENFAQLEKASAKVDFESLGNAISSINSKLGVMGVVGAKVISDLTGAVIGKAKDLFNTLTITPLTTGLEEYETQLNAVQTILANTAKHGTTLDDVNAALDQLNTYADKTIYNFTQMTNSIGKFTTAGVDLDTSVSAIKGIANLAALSGSSAEQASTAMYQLSQAISSGTLRLQDWISVENAGMGGELFKQSLIDTARVHGIEIDRIIKNNEGFRNSLQEGWISSTILLDSLAQFTGDLTDSQLESMGFAEDQIAEIQKLAVTANDAATKIKTLTQLKDTLSEALQSGWSTTWRIIFGDFEEAKVLWGNMGDLFGNMIGLSADARNKQLAFWKAAGGRDILIRGLFNTLEGISNILKAIGTGFHDVFAPIRAGDLLKASKLFFNFGLGLKQASQNTEGLRAIIRGLASALDIVFLAVKAILVPLKEAFSRLSPAAGSFLDMAVNAAEAITAFRDFAKETGFFNDVVSRAIEFLGWLGQEARKLGVELSKLQVVKDISKWISSIKIGSMEEVTSGFMELAEEAKNLINELFGFDIVQRVIDWFNELSVSSLDDLYFFILNIGDKVRELVKQFLALDIVKDVIEWCTGIKRENLLAVWQIFLNILTVLAAPLGLVALGIKKLCTEMKRLGVVQSVNDWFKSIPWDEYKAKVLGLADGFKEWFDGMKTSVKESELIKSFLGYIETFDGRRWEKFVTQAKDSFGWAGDLSTKLKDIFSGVSIDWGAILEGLKTFGAFLQDHLVNIFDYLTENAGKVDYQALFETINAGLIGGLILSINRLVNGTWVKDALQKVFGGGVETISGALSNTLGAMESTLVSFQNNIKADTLQKIAISIALLVGSIALLTLLDPEKLAVATAAVAGMIVALFGSAGALKFINPASALKQAGTIIGMSLAILIMAKAMNEVSELKPADIKTSLAALTTSLSSLVLSMIAIEKTGGGSAGLIKTAGTLLGLAIGVSVFGKAIQTFGEMDPETLAVGLVSVTAALGLLTSSVAILSKVGKTKMKAVAIAILGMSIALIKLAESTAILGEMDLDKLVKGLSAIGSILLAFALYSRILKPKRFLEAAVGFWIVGDAIARLIGPITQLGELEPDKLVQGIGAIAAVLGVFALASKAMTGGVGGAAAAFILSVAILAIAGALKVLSTLSWEGLAIGLAAIAGVLAILGIAGALMGPVVPVLLGLGVAILAIGAGAALFGVGVTLAAAGLVALAGSAVAIGAAIRIVAQAIEDILPGLGTALATALSNFIIVIGDKSPEISEAFKAIILTMIDTSYGLLPDILALGLTIIVELLNALAIKIPEIIQAGADIIVNFLQGIADNIDDIVEAGLDIIEGILDGISDGLPDIIDGAFEVIVSFLNGIADAIEEHLPEIIDAGIRIGDAILDGVVQAITEGLTRITNAATNLGHAVVDGLKSLLGIESPSTVTYELAENIVKGLVNGVDDNVGRVQTVFKKLVEKVQNGIKPLSNVLSKEVEDKLTFRPKIIPILDAGSFNSDLRGIGRTLSNSTLLARVEDAARSSFDQPSGGKVSNGASVAFYQYNTSPKALDAAEIYRDTKSIVGRLKGKI